MTMNSDARYWAMRRIIAAATGDEYPDGEFIMDYGVGIADENHETVWVTGNWNVQHWWTDERKAMAERLGNALERINVELLWHDEYEQCCECSMIIRIRPDGAFWRPEYVATGNGYVCRECILEKYSPFELVEESDEADNARGFMFTGAEEWLQRHSWVKFNGEYATGWYGRHDEPEDIVTAIREQFEDAPVALVSGHSHMFETQYVAYYLVHADDETLLEAAR